MKIFHRPLQALVLTAGLALGGSVSLYAAGQDIPPGEVYPAPYTSLRGMIDQTQSDLRVAAGLEHENGKQRERYREAQGHLSTFDRHIVKGKFDKGELDKAIGEIKGILDHNVLQASSRDALGHDLDQLRAARDHRY